MLAIDGKTVRRSHDRRQKKGPLHLVSAWATRSRLVLGQTEVAEDSNEITAIPELLEMLELSGCIVSIDAIGCQKTIAQQITTNSIESVWAILKRSHKGVYHHWSKKHGHRYYNEIAYRLTEGNVKIPVMVRIRKLTRKTFEVQLTYKALTR